MTNTHCVWCGAELSRDNMVKINIAQPECEPEQLRFHWECFWAAGRRLKPSIRQRVEQCRQAGAGALKSGH